MFAEVFAGGDLENRAHENRTFRVEDAAANEMASRVAAYEWGTTPLGPINGWPLNLRTAVDICLHSRFPMRVWWGPELVNIYNDAYAIVLGDRHPSALGRSAPQIWPDVWPAIYPQVEAVMQRGESTWQQRFLLKVQRNGKPDEIWLTWSYSPIRNLDGSVAGMMCVATEDTAHILADRERQRFAEQREDLLRSLEAERANLAELVDDQVRSRDAVRQAAADAIAAAEANAKFRTFFEQGTYFAGVMSVDGTVVEANRVSLEGCGYTRAKKSSARSSGTAAGGTDRPL
jgi:PAS domain-containing protein